MPKTGSRSEEIVLQSLREIGLPEQSVVLQRGGDAAGGERLRFHGSPTVLVNGEDPIADPDASVDLMCRVYRTEVGLAGSPTLKQSAALQSSM